WLHQSCSYKRVSSVGRFYDGLRAARWRAERFPAPSPVLACRACSWRAVAFSAGGGGGRRAAGLPAPSETAFAAAWRPVRVSLGWRSHTWRALTSTPASPRTHVRRTYPEQ